MRVLNEGIKKYFVNRENVKIECLSDYVERISKKLPSGTKYMQYLIVSELAAKYKVTPRTVYRWIYNKY